MWTRDLLWMTFKMEASPESHVLDHEGELGEREHVGFLLLLSRLPEWRPLEKVVYAFSPRERNSRRPAEEHLRHSVFSPEKAAGESDSSESLSRVGVRVLLGRDAGRGQKWSNSMLKRRAVRGGESGTLTHSNVFRECNPVHAPFSGSNEPRLPGAPRDTANEIGH